MLAVHTLGLEEARRVSVRELGCSCFREEVWLE